MVKWWRRSPGRQTRGRLRGSLESQTGLVLQGWCLAEEGGAEQFELACQGQRLPLAVCRIERADVSDALQSERLHLGFWAPLPTAVWSLLAGHGELQAQVLVNGQPLGGAPVRIRPATLSDEWQVLGGPASAGLAAQEQQRRLFSLALHTEHLLDTSPPWLDGPLRTLCDELAQRLGLDGLAADERRRLMQPVPAEVWHTVRAMVMGREAVTKDPQPPATWPLALTLSAWCASDEFREQVLRPLLAQGELPHDTLGPLDLGPLQAAWGEAFAAAHLRGPGAPDTVAALDAMLSHPPLGRWMLRWHGSWWQEARPRLAQGRRFLGRIELVDWSHIHGWLMDPCDPERVLRAEIRCGEQTVAIAPAHGPRSDVKDRFGGAGHCGLRAAWSPARFSNGAPLCLTLHEADTGQQVGPAFEFDNSGAERRRLSQLLSHELQALQQQVQALAALMPQAVVHSAYPVDQYHHYRVARRVPPPPAVASPPRFTVVLDAEGADSTLMRRSLDAVRHQSLAPQQILLRCDDAELNPVADQQVAADARLQRLTDWPAVSAVLADDPQSWVLLLQSGDVLDPEALAWLAFKAQDASAPVAQYWDEDRLHWLPGRPPLPATVRYERPVLRAPFDPDAMLELNIVGLGFAARADALSRALSRVAQADPSLPALHPQRRELLIWALHDQGRLLHQAWPLLSWCSAPDAPDTRLADLVAQASPQQLRPLLPPEMAGLAWQRQTDPLARSRKRLVRWQSPEPDETVAVLIPTRDAVDLVAQCVTSLFDMAARPERLELWIADNGSTDPSTLAYLAEGQAQGRFQVLRVDEPFNWSRLNNQLVRAAKASRLLFLNNDTLMLTRDWDEILCGWLARSDVGAVGARLLYDDLTLQHAGIVFGHEGFVGHEAVFRPVDDERALFDTQLSRRVGGVTGAFLACRREVFEAIGGFDEHELCVAFNDVDWCLRLRQSGRAIVYAPQLSLIHYESKTRGADDASPEKRARAAYERERLEARWPGAFQTDPCRSPALSDWVSSGLMLR